MAVNTAHIATLLRPGMQAFMAGFDPPPPKFDPAWRKLYEAEVRRAREHRWLSMRTPAVRARIERLNLGSQEFGQKMRGWHPKSGLLFEDNMGVVSVFKYIERWGVEPVQTKWNARHFLKHGRKKYVTIEFLEFDPGAPF